MNQRPSIVDQPIAAEWVSSHEATGILGVKAETLYAYASRGLVRTAAGRGGRERVYQREDLERLVARSRARSGHGAVAAGALRLGEPVLETRIGTIDARGPVYRGQVALELAKRGTHFEEICALLWGSPWTTPRERGLGAHIPSLRTLVRNPGTHRAQRADREADAARTAGEGARAGRDAGGGNGSAQEHALGGTPFDGMVITAAALSAMKPRAETVEMARERAPLLVRRLVAACGLPIGADAVNAALGADRLSRALLLALGGRATAARVGAMDEALVLSADHELNASTFAARVAASSGANLASTIMAAIGTLSGPLHGAVTARVEAFIDEVDRPERASEIVRLRLDRGESVPGFGHPLYPQGDPRGARLVDLATRIAGKARAVRTIVAIVNAMELAVRERPTLDIGLVALSAALGLPPGTPIAIFACGRLAGWIAHALEQREAGYLLRPRARYVGA